MVETKKTGTKEQLWQTSSPQFADHLCGEEGGREEGTDKQGKEEVEHKRLVVRKITLEGKGMSENGREKKNQLMNTHKEQWSLCSCV